MEHQPPHPGMIIIIPNVPERLQGLITLLEHILMHYQPSPDITIMILQAPEGPEELNTLLEYIRSVLQWKLDVTTQMGGIVAESPGTSPAKPGPTDPTSARCPLIEREQQVLYWRLEGLSRKDIARQMSFSDEYVKKIIKTILDKPQFQGMRQAWEAANFARDRGWIPPKGSYTRHSSITPASPEHPQRTLGAASPSKETQGHSGTLPLGGLETDPTVP